MSESPEVQDGLVRHFFGALGFCAGIAFTGVFFFVVTLGGPKAAHAFKGPDVLANWSNAKVRSQLGEAQQVVDCSQLGLPNGLTCRLYVNQAKQRIVILATP